MTGFQHAPPQTEEEFQAFMEAMDRHFAELKMPIPARQLAAIAEVCHSLGKDVRAPASRALLENSYVDEDLILRAIAWFDERYGDAQKVYFGPGRTLLALRGDVWLIEYPTVTGQAGFYAGDGPDAQRAIYQRDGTYRQVLADSPEWLNPELRKLDVLIYIKRLPPGLRKILHRGELNGILHVFCRCRLILHTLVMARRYRFIESARSDLDSAVNYVVAHPPAPGHAKWSSLQAVEKAFKSFLSYAGAKYPTSGRKGHDLLYLHDLVKRAGGPTFREEDILAIRCDSSVRYGTQEVTLEEATRAHFLALELAGAVALWLRHRYPDPHI